MNRLEKLCNDVDNMFILKEKFEKLNLFKRIIIYPFLWVKIRTVYQFRKELEFENKKNEEKNNV